MTVRTYAIAFEVELLDDEDGQCYAGHRIYNAAGDIPTFAVRNHDGSKTVMSCAYHLGKLMRQWDELADCN